jgi:hypothetical protein
MPRLRRIGNPTWAASLQGLIWLIWGRNNWIDYRRKALSTGASCAQGTNEQEKMMAQQNQGGSTPKGGDQMNQGGRDRQDQDRQQNLDRQQNKQGGQGGQSGADQRKGGAGGTGMGQDRGGQSGTDKDRSR